jgi:hypothetical protein
MVIPKIVFSCGKGIVRESKDVKKTGNLGRQVAVLGGTWLVEKDCRQILAVCSVNYGPSARKSTRHCANH